MQRFSLSLAGASAVLAFVLAAGSARAATIDHTWVSSTGGGTACTRAAPCGDFATAYSATNAGGVISVLDSGEYGTLTLFIQKSITIRADSVDGGAVKVGNGRWIVVNASASDVISLEGLHFAGAGIELDSGGSLYIRNCVIRNDAAGYGVFIIPTGPAKVVISDTVVMNNSSTGGSGAGIWIVPGAGGSAQVTLNRVIAEGNQSGIVVDGSTSTGGINVTITDSVTASNAQDGIVASTPAGGAPIGVMVENTKSTNNAFGIRSFGPNATVRVSESTVTGNGTGLFFTGGGALLSFGNNEVEANATNGAFSNPAALK